MTVTVTVLLTAAPELLTRVDSLISALTDVCGVQTVRSVKVRPEDGQPGKKISLPETTTEEETPKFTLEQVRAAAQAKSQSGKREEVRALVTEFGATNLPSLDPTKFNEFMSKLEAL